MFSTSFDLIFSIFSMDLRSGAIITDLSSFSHSELKTNASQEICVTEFQIPSKFFLGIELTVQYFSRTTNILNLLSPKYHGHICSIPISKICDKAPILQKMLIKILVFNGSYNVFPANFLILEHFHEL